jgi:hypothetical protein
LDFKLDIGLSPKAFGDATSKFVLDSPAALSFVKQLLNTRVVSNDAGLEVNAESGGQESPQGG